MEYRGITCDFKELDTKSGRFRGKAAVYNKIDLGGDIIEPGAFTKTLREQGDELPLMMDHYKLIGQVKAVDKDSALWADPGALDMENPDAKTLYRTLKPMDGFSTAAVKGLSIGYQTVKKEYDQGSKPGDTPVRHILEAKLFEISVVTFPMQPAAQIMSVKSQDLKDQIREVMEGTINDRLKKIESQFDELKSALADEGIMLEPDGHSKPTPTEPDDHSAKHMLEMFDAYLLKRKLDSCQI